MVKARACILFLWLILSVVGFRLIRKKEKAPIKETGLVVKSVKRGLEAV